MIAVVDPTRMTLADFLKLFDLTPVEDDMDKPLNDQQLGYVEFVRTDYSTEVRARVRLTYRYDLKVDLEIGAEHV